MAKPETADDPAPDMARPFHYAEECGLALFQDKHTSRKHWIEKGMLTHLENSFRNGWQTSGGAPPGPDT